jgi:hypothetical protein
MDMSEYEGVVRMKYLLLDRLVKLPHGDFTKEIDGEVDAIMQRMQSEVNEAYGSAYMSLRRLLRLMNIYEKALDVENFDEKSDC